MAYSERSSDRDLAENDEIYTGRTRISNISTPSEQSGASSPSDTYENSGHFDLYEDQSDISNRSTHSNSSEDTKYIERLMHSNHMGHSSMNSLEVRASQPWKPSKMRGHSNLRYKHHEGSSSSSSSPLSLPPAECRTYTHSKATSNSLCSYSDMYGSLKHLDEHGNLVPSLALTSRVSTVDYMREMEGLKLDREPQVAYETWAASKKRLRQQALKRQQLEHEEKMQKHAMRKQLAERCYEEWLQEKAKEASRRRMDEHLQQAALQAASSAASSTASRHKTGRNVTQAEIRQVVESWWQKKQEQRKRQRTEQEHMLVLKARENERRKQQAEAAWQKWMSNVFGKPKPVPMNQGLDSLRGSVSAMYINPIPWQHLKKDKDELKYAK